MENEKLWLAKKNDYEEQVTYEKICELVNYSPNFLYMIKRMQINDILIYNEKNIEFKRIR